MAISCLLFCSLSVLAQQGVPLADQIEKADSLHLHSQYATAAEAFQDILSSIGAEDPLRIEVLQKQGDALMNSNKTAEAQKALEASLALAQKLHGEASPEAARSYYFLAKNISFHRQRSEETLGYISKSLEIGRQLQSERPEIAGNALIMSGRVNMISGKYQLALDHYQEALELMADVTDKATLREKTWAYSGIGWVNIALQNQVEAIDALETGIAINTDLYPANHGRFSQDLRLLGQAYTRLAQYENALKTLSRSMETQLAIFGKNHPNTASVYSSMADLFDNTGQYNKAIEYGMEALSIRRATVAKNDPALLPYYNKLAFYFRGAGDPDGERNALQSAIDIARTARKDNPNLITLYSRLVRHLLNRKQFAEADNLLAQLEQLILNLVGKEHRVYADYERLKAVRYYDEGRFDRSLAYLRRAIPVFEEKLSPFHVNQAQLRHDYANAFFELEQYDSADYYYDQTIEFCRKGKENSALSVHELNFDDVNHPHFFNSAMYRKALVRQLWFEETGDIELLKESLQYHESALRVFEGTRNRLIVQSVGKTLFSLVGDGYEAAANTAYQLYEATGESTYADAFFQLSERSKAFIFLRELNQRQTLQYGNVPQELIQKNLDLISEIRFYGSLVSASLQRNQLANAEKYREKYFAAREAHDSLLAEMGAQYPDFFGMRYRPEVLSLNEAQNNLTASGSGILNYVVSKEHLYIQLITREQSWLKQVPTLANLEEQIALFRKSYADYAYISDSTSAANAHFLEKGHALYQQLVAPVAEGLAGVNNLVIVPYAGLYDLNFELLLKEPTEGNFSYRNLPYLLKDMAVTYANSYTVHDKLQSVQNEGNTRSFGGFATDLAATNDRLEARNMANFSVRSPGYSADATLKEVSEIADLLGGDSFLKEAATEGNFKSLSGNYRVLHLAMHGDVDNRNQSNSALIFSQEPDGSEDGLLTVEEIYGLQLRSDLVVLSACNTGYNDLTINGEGMLSMSRGFMFSGVPAMVMSLWSIPDETTAQIMVDFYKNMSDGASKPTSLQQAKLNYLATNDDDFYNHPYFWAGLSHTGNTQALDLNKGIPVYYWLSALLILAVLALLRLRSKSRHQV